VFFKELVAMMVQPDLELAERERTLIDAGRQAAIRGAASG
jgi:hypothetical protein